MYLYKEQDTLVGAMALTMYQGEDYHAIEWSEQVPDDEVAVIHILAVSPDRQGTGIGSKMVRDAIELAKVKGIPASKMKKSIAEILLNEGYIKNYQVIDDGTQGIIRITLKYLPGKEKAIQGLRRVSKPGLRVYAGADELPRVLKGLGIAIISTSKGVMTDKEARKQHVGGEVLAFVW